MLYPRSSGYDPASGVLTVRFASPSRTRWATYQYRDVPPGVAEAVAAARPHLRQVLEQAVLPHYPARRAGSSVWRTPPEHTTDG